MKSIVSDSNITRVSAFDSGADWVRLREAGDGAAAIGISLPGSGDR